MKINKKFLLILIFLIAFLIRFIGVNQSLWLDEATTARTIQHFSYLDIITKFSPHDFHPPTFYLFMKAWTGIFGYSETALRMPSIFFSIATGWIIYLIGGIWAAAFFLFNPLIVYYSQEARMYMMTTFFLTFAIFYLEKMLSTQIANLKSQNPNSKIGYVLLMSIFLSVSFLTFYGSAFLIVAVLIYLLYKKEYKAFFISGIIFFGAAALISPLIFQQLSNARISLSQVSNWSLVLGKANLKNLLLIPLKFSIGRIDFYPKSLYYLIGGLWTVLLFVFIFLNLKIENSLKNSNPKLKIVWLYLFIFTLLFALIASFVTPLLQYFRFLYLIPLMCLLLVPPVNLRGWIVALGFVVFSLVYLLMPQFYREDWKSLASNLDKKIPVYMIASSSDPVSYYQPKLQISDLRIIETNPPIAKEIIVIPYTADIYGLEYKSRLMKDGYILKNEKTYRGLIVEDWNKL